MDLLVGTAREQGTTVVLVTHEPRVAAYADREVVVRDGRVTPLHRRVAVMIRFGLRLTLRGGREAVVRLVVIARRRRARRRPAAGHPGRRQRGRRPERPVRLAEHRHPGGDRPGAVPSPDPLWWQLARATTTHGRSHQPGRRRRDRARVPGPAGHPALPGPGEYYASPALARCCARRRPTSSPTATPASWSARSATRRCPSPNSLIVVVGRTADELSQHGRAPSRSRTIATALARRLPAAAASASTPTASTSCSVVIAVALLFPVLMFIGTATRLSAARREQRFAAMRLVGATPRQITVIAAVESTVGGRRRHRASGSACSSPLRAPLSTRSRSPASRSSASDLSLDAGRRARRRARRAARPPAWRRGSRCAGCGSRRWA